MKGCGGIVRIRSGGGVVGRNVGWRIVGEDVGGSACTGNCNLVVGLVFGMAGWPRVDTV